MQRQSIRFVFGIFVSLMLVLAVPGQAHAAGATFFGPIVPAECHCDNQSVNGDGAKITTAPDYGCALQVIQNLINFGITLSTILFTIYLAITGIAFITSGGSSEARSKAKTRFTNVFVGLIVLLCAWLIVDYVMKTLYNDASFGPWNAILSGERSGSDRCIVARTPTAISVGSIISGLVGNATTETSGVVSSDSGIVTAGKLSDAEVRAQLRTAGVNIAQGFAAAKSLANTRVDTVNQIVSIKQSCGCTVQVNATTGGTHSTTGDSHGEGYKADLQPNAALDAFLKSLRRNGSRSDGTQLYFDSCGNEYARESSHWDITVNKGSCKLGR